MADGRAVLITGGASGIGLAAAQALLAEGWRVAVADIAEDTLAVAEADLAAHGPDRVRFHPLDVTDEGAVRDTVARVERDLGPLRGAVNSAGIGRDVPFLDTTADLMRRMLEVNLVGTFLVGREAALAMAGRGGAIVNITSISGLRGNVGRAAYGASKGGVVTLTEVMAVELAAAGIRVNAVAPGPVETPLVRAMHTAEARQAWASVVPQRRYADPAEVAGAIAFLLDEARASFITGQVLAVDGGFIAGGLLPPYKERTTS